jgi:hypothetical protein
MNMDPDAILALGAKGLISHLPMRQIVRHQAPGTASAQHILDAIEHLAHGVFPRSTASLFRRQEGCQNLHHPIRLYFSRESLAKVCDLGLLSIFSFT